MGDFGKYVKGIDVGDLKGWELPDKRTLACVNEVIAMETSVKTLALKLCMLFTILFSIVVFVAFIGNFITSERSWNAATIVPLSMTIVGILFEVILIVLWRTMYKTSKCASAGNFETFRCRIAYIYSFEGRYEVQLETCHGQRVNSRFSVDAVRFNLSQTGQDVRLVYFPDTWYSTVIPEINARE